MTIRHYRQIHRNFFMGEKLLYYKRRQEAKESDGRVWSIILDGMSSNSTQIPIGSHTREYKPSFATHIQGCISHGKNETTLYTTFPNIMTGASFMIDILHREFDRCLKDGRPLPEKVYIQVTEPMFDEQVSYQVLFLPLSPLSLYTRYHTNYPSPSFLLLGGWWF
jgi:hypothetical protein